MCCATSYEQKPTSEELNCAIQQAQREAKNWRAKCEEANRRLRDANRQLSQLRGDYDAMRQSMSFRLGRALTWLPRKLRRGIKCLRDNGLKYTAKLLLIKIIKKVLPESFLLLNIKFCDNVLAGFNVYSELIKKYGEDVTILGCAFGGTGDYYICGLYLPEYLKKNNISNYVFLGPCGAEEKVMELYEEMGKHRQQLILKDFTLLRIFRGFIGVDKQNFIYLQHYCRFPQNNALNITNSELIGHNGLNLVDFYLSLGFDLPDDAPRAFPVFKEDRREISALFREKHLLLGRTVLLSPYSTGLKQYQLPMRFWEILAEKLAEKGFTACTNCAGSEQPIKGTVPIFLPYKIVVPFLNYSGGYIGIRSGLCDIISTASCKKVILHTYKAAFWPDGKSIAYTGLNNMGLCDDAIELEYNGTNQTALLKEIIQQISEE